VFTQTHYYDASREWYFWLLTFVLQLPCSAIKKALSKDPEWWGGGYFPEPNSSFGTTWTHSANNFGVYSRLRAVQFVLKGTKTCKCGFI